jgi:hypothetical protein
LIDDPTLASPVNDILQFLSPSPYQSNLGGLLSLEKCLISFILHKMNLTLPHLANFQEPVKLKLHVLGSPLPQDLADDVNAPPVALISVDLNDLLSSLNNTDFSVTWTDDLIAETGINWTHFHYPNTGTPTAYMDSSGTYL